MAKTSKAKGRTKAGNRSGVPFILYLDEHQAEKLAELARERRLTKTAIIKFAMDKLFLDIQGGQLDLPLGLEEVKQ